MTRARQREPKRERERRKREESKEKNRIEYYMTYYKRAHMYNRHLEYEEGTERRSSRKPNDHTTKANKMKQQQ